VAGDGSGDGEGIGEDGGTGPKASRRGLTIALIAAAAAIVVVAGVALAFILPRLGRSGRAVSLTVEASTPSGGAPSGADLDRTRRQLVARMKAAGLDKPTVDRSGDRRLVLHAKATTGAISLRDLIAPDQLRIRRVLASSDNSANPDNSGNSASAPSAPPSGPAGAGEGAAPGGTPAPGGTQAPGGIPAPGGTQAPGGIPAPGGTPAPGATQAPGGIPAPGGTPAPGGLATPGANTAPGSDMDPTSEPNGPTGPTGPTDSGQPGDLSPGPRASVAAKLGPAYAAADQVASFEEGQALPANVLQAFAALSPEEIAVLPEQMQLYVPTVSCDALRARPLAAIVQPDQEIVACDGDGRKYLLDVATVTGTDIRSAKSAEDQGLWTVTVALTADGQQRFTAVTRDLATDHGQLAIIVDETVVSAPTVQAEIPGDLQISGAFTANQAKLLAAQLAGGELPLVLNPIR